ncbi:Outer membrane protein TolC [Zhouia amylolytica]|uniref:Outer membrane protein TolC n=1 Tax=Zhouia amylolytica TaxID=376730 RepID=A0A1I6P7T7_9FLAO|nr:TolC family protein [Zhouia amylolytica]SFS36257.1 Outer membrane protein TolC [Zhouia amylolytica]
MKNTSDVKKWMSLVGVLILVNTAAMGQDLEAYVNIALKNSPKLQAKQLTYESSLEAVSEVGSIPNTTIGGGYFVQEAETRVGPQRAKLSASQMFPWFGTLKAKKQASGALAESDRFELGSTTRDITLKVKQAYYKLYEKKASIEIIEENLNILKTYEELALNELENNRTTMVDVLKIRIQINELKNQKEVVNEELVSDIKGFNLLLNRSILEEVKIVDTLKVTQEVFSKENLIDNPKLLKIEAMKEATAQSELAATKENAPSIGVGLDYVFVDERDMVMPDNGKDIVMPMVNLSIPLFSKKFTSKRKQLQLQQEALANTKIDAENELETLFEDNLAALNNAKRTISTQTENVHQAKQAEQVILTTYQTGTIDFEQVLEVQQLILKYQLSTLQALTAYHNSKAALESLTK